MFKVTLTITLILIAVNDCNSQKRDFKVINGAAIERWSLNPFRFMVMLYGNVSCSGVVLSSMTVLSAGHCFMDSTKEPTRVAVAYTGPKVTTETEFVEIDTIFIPPDYEADFASGIVSGNDFAVVKLQSLIDTAQRNHELAGVSTEKLSIGLEVFIVGYGGSNTMEEGDRILKSGRAIVAECPGEPTDQRICATKHASYANQEFEAGDAGGPLASERLNNFYISGFYSGEIQSDNTNIMVFASYKQHVRFIQKIISAKTNVCKVK